MPSYSMNYAAIKAAIYERRFPSSSPVEQWVAAAYADIWNAAPWTFKAVPNVAFSVSSQTPTMPTDFRKVVKLVDDQGDPLKEVTWQEFADRFTGDTTTGRPDTFAVVNRQIYLWPIPSAAFSFFLSYQRRYATRTSGGAVQQGFFVDDADLPLWDDHHYIIVIRSKIVGLKDRSDPTAGDLEGEYQRLFSSMVDDYIQDLPRGLQVPAWRG